MNTFWCFKGYLFRSSEHLYFSLTALYLLLVFFHFKNESTDLINWCTCLFSPLFTLRLAFWCSYVWIYSYVQTNAEESSVFAQSWRGCLRPCASDVCVRFRCVCVCVCVWETSHTALDCYFNNPECLLCSPCAFGQSLYRVLTREIERECTRWW